MKSFRILIIAAVLAASVIASSPAQATYKLFWGGTHAHTSFSDGKETPDKMWDYARNVGKVDFWFSTEHYHSLYEVANMPGVPAGMSEWQYVVNTAKEKTENGKFVALPGWEWGDGKKGHINVLFDTTTPPAALMVGYFDRFVKFWVKKHPKAITGLNHPFWSADNGMNNFDNYTLVPEIVEQTVYIEVNGPEEIPFYYLALDRGWKVAPVAAQDNHSPDWGTRVEFSGVYADELTPESLLAAFKARRFFATNDRPMKIWMEANSTPMGGEITADEADFSITVSRPDGVPVQSLKIMSNEGRTVAAWTPTTADFNVTHKMKVKFKEDKRWFVALAMMADGRFSISAPIWITKK